MNINPTPANRNYTFINPEDTFFIISKHSLAKLKLMNIIYVNKLVLDESRFYLDIQFGYDQLY